MSESLVPELPTGPQEPAARAPTDWKTDVMQKRIRARYAKERRFRFWGLAAVVGSAGFLAFLLVCHVLVAKAFGLSRSRRDLYLVCRDCGHYARL